jgi:phosphate transport system substrate-binding protein
MIPMKNLTSLLLLVSVLSLCITGCKPNNSAGPGSSQGAGKAIQIKGSDTMVNLAQAWAEEFKKVQPQIDVEVSGGGSGVGIAALVKGTIEIATASRDLKPEEIEQAKQNTGKTPKEFIVGYDGLAVYVNKDNPLNEISVEQLAQIYAEGGTCTRWSQLGVKIPNATDDTIVRVSRQNSSGTYEFFREHVLNKKDFANGSRDMNGSKEVVALVSSTPTAIGYSGMGYATAQVKMLKVASKPGEPAVAPTVENTLSKKYPIARSLQLYTLGEPEGPVKTFVDWTLSAAGQKMVTQTGYVPLPVKPTSP